MTFRDGAGKPPHLPAKLEMIAPWSNAIGVSDCDNEQSDSECNDNDEPHRGQERLAIGRNRTGCSRLRVRRIHPARVQERAGLRQK